MISCDPPQHEQLVEDQPAHDCLVRRHARLHGASVSKTIAMKSRNPISQTKVMIAVLGSEDETRSNTTKCRHDSACNSPANHFEVAPTRRRGAKMRPSKTARSAGKMGMAAEDFAAEFYGPPEYVITHIRTEKLKNGNTRVYHWVERNGSLVPCFMALIATTDLVSMNEAVQESLSNGCPPGQRAH